MWCCPTAPDSNPGKKKPGKFFYNFLPVNHIWIFNIVESFYHASISDCIVMELLFISRFIQFRLCGQPYI